MRIEVGVPTFSYGMVQATKLEFRLAGTATTYQSTRVIIDPFHFITSIKRIIISTLKPVILMLKIKVNKVKALFPLTTTASFNTTVTLRKIKFNIVAGLAGFADVVNPVKGSVGSLIWEKQKIQHCTFRSIREKILRRPFKHYYGYAL
jgi:hypothetical protein